MGIVIWKPSAQTEESSNESNQSQQNIDLSSLADKVLATAARKAGAMGTLQYTPVTEPAPIPVERVLALPDKRAPKKTAVPTPAKTATKNKKPEPMKFDRYSKSDSNYITFSDGSRKLVTVSDMQVFVMMDYFGFLTMGQITALRDTTRPYALRRTKDFEKKGLFAKRIHPLHQTVWVLTSEARTVIDSQLMGKMLSVVPKPFKPDHVLQALVNTVAVKLSTGADENILFDSSVSTRHDPMPLLSKAFIQASCLAKNHQGTGDIGKFMDARDAVENSVATNPKHAHVKSPSKHYAAIYHGLSEGGKTGLEKIYQQMSQAWIFAPYDTATGEFETDLVPDFVNLRPIVQLKEGWDFNHDAVVVITKPMPQAYYKALILSLIACGMYGRLFIFRSPNKSVADIEIMNAWKSIMDEGTLGANLIPFGESECFVKVRDLPEPLSNTGSGDDRFNELGQRMARTNYDG